MQITIIGLGLIGGSIGLKLKSLNQPDLKVVGVPRREETIGEAIKLGAIDEGTTDFVKGVSAADFVIIATPLHLIIPALEKISPALKKGAIVTDVGSAKEGIVKQAEKLMPAGTFFLGSHPLAGKERVKLEAAEAGLFEDKAWAITPTPKTSPKVKEALAKLITLLGARVVELDPKTHDLAVAGISHGPLVVAAALVNSVADAKAGHDAMKQLAASGFRDTTRIASSDPILGVDMFSANHSAVVKALAAFKKSFVRLEKLIKDKNYEAIKKELDQAKIFRDGLFG